MFVSRNKAFFGLFIIATWFSSISNLKAGPLIARNSSRCLDIGGASQDPGARLVQWDCASVANQDFDWIDAGAGFASIKLKHSGQCLEANANPGDSAFQRPCDQDDSQKWEPLGKDGGYHLRNKASGLCLDIWGWETNNGTKVSSAVCHFGSNQTFMFLDDPQMLRLARNYAPLIQLHPEEDFFPSSVEYFAAHTDVHCQGQKVRESVLDAVYLPYSPQDCFVQTQDAMNGIYDVQGFMRGQDPRRDIPPVYASVYSPSFGVVHIQYAMFYPYNYGKDVCFSLAPAGYCLSKRVAMGNHLGDWESITLRLEGGRVTAIRMGAHGQRKNYGPHEVEWRGDHPVVYSAKGSHGLYPRSGDYTYRSLPTGDKLVDIARSGIEWQSAEALVLLNNRENWMNYRGHWGTERRGKNACQLTPLNVINSLRKVWNPLGSLFGARLETTEEICGRLGLNDEYQIGEGPWWQSFDQDRWGF